MTRRAWFAVGALGAMAAAAAGALTVRAPHVGAVERGRRLAQEHGCFGCHGPGGVTGLPDPGNGITVPAFSNEDVKAYAKSVGEIREWIADGGPRRIREQEGEGEADAFLVMPAFGDRLTPREIDDLVAYVAAASNYEDPPAGPARNGREVAERMGCFACHGPQGRGALANPGSFKGYVAPWDGKDFPELVEDDAELKAWILDGMPDRLRENTLARHFLDHQVVKMPGYRGRMADEDLAAVMAYIHWLRSQAR